jgi:hypothetical protein
MEKGHRLLYVGGVAVLLLLALWAVVTRGVSEEELAGDGGPAPTDAAGDAVSVAEGAGDGASEAAEASAGEVPTDGSECENYCRQLEETGGLAEGVTTQACVERLCAAPSGDGAPPAALDVPPAVEAPGEETAGDCRQQCRTLQAQGELRAGTTLEQCYAALCAP